MKNTKKTSQSTLRGLSSLFRYRRLLRIGKGKYFELKKKGDSYHIVKKMLLIR